MRLINLSMVIVLLFVVGCKKADFDHTECPTPNFSYQPGPAGSYPEVFSVSGNRIVSASNEDVVFRGVSIESPPVLAKSLEDRATGGEFYFSKYLEWDAEIFRQIAEWGATIVRLPVYPAAWEILDKSYCMEKLDEAIQWAESNELYVIIEWHSVGFLPTNEYENNNAGAYGQLYETSMTQTTDFWNEISQRYQSNPTVAFYEIFNEPTFPDFSNSNYSPSPELWNTWKSVAENLINTIRSNDPNKPIIVGAPNWSYDLQYVISNPVQGSGIIYSAHPYPGVNHTLSWDLAFGNVKNTYPVFVTEVGYQLNKPLQKPYFFDDYVEANGLPGAPLYGCAIQTYLEQKKISWTAWCFSPYTWPKLLDDHTFKATNAGRFFRDWMQAAK